MRRILIFVLGLGCNETEQIRVSLQKYFRTPCIVMCNKSLGKTIVNIGKTVCYLPPSKKSKFVHEVFYEVLEHANRDYNVTVVGHSYGGSVVSRVAEILTDKGITKTNIRMITTGSIYVPKPNLTKNANIRHLMFKNDVALRCNHLNPRTDTYVDWLVHKTHKNYEPKFFNIFGSGTEWEVHNDYFEILYKMIKIEKNNKLNAAERSLRKLGIHEKLKNYIGGGANGRVFETNNGNLIKMIAGNNPMEYEALKIMEGSGITPHLKKNGKVFKTTNQNLQNLFKKQVRRLTVFKMNKINANKVITMRQFIKNNPEFDWKKEHKRLLEIIHSRGLTHGDFHLDNVLVSLKDKQPKFWAINFGRSVKLPAGITEKSLFKTKFFGPLYRKHHGMNVYLTRNDRLVKPNYQMYNLSKSEKERAKTYKYLPNLNYLRKFGFEPINFKKEPIQKHYRKRITKEPRLRKFNAPRKMNIKIPNKVNLQNYINIYKKIRRLTNVPGAYQLRKNLESNLTKKLSVRDYVSQTNFKPFEKNHYYLKYGKDPKRWMFLLPESYNHLKKIYGNRSFTIRNYGVPLHVSNFKFSAHHK